MTFFTFTWMWIWWKLFISHDKTWEAYLFAEESSLFFAMQEFILKVPNLKTCLKLSLFQTAFQHLFMAYWLKKDAPEGGTILNIRSCHGLCLVTTPVILNRIRMKDTWRGSKLHRLLLPIDYLPCYCGRAANKAEVWPDDLLTILYRGCWPVLGWRTKIRHGGNMED